MHGQGRMCTESDATEVIKCWGKLIRADFDVKNLHLTRRDAASGEQKVVASVEGLQGVANEVKAVLCELKSNMLDVKLGVDMSRSELALLSATSRTHAARAETIEISLRRFVESHHHSGRARRASHAAGRHERGAWLVSRRRCRGGERPWWCGTSECRGGEQPW